MCTSRALRPGAPGRPAGPRQRVARHDRAVAVEQRGGEPGLDRAAATPSDRRGAARRRRRARAPGRRAPRPGAASPSTRARRSTSPAGTRIQSSRSSGRRQRGRHAVLEQQEPGPPVPLGARRAAPPHGPAHEDDIHAGDRKEGTFRGCFAPVKRFAPSVDARRGHKARRVPMLRRHGSPVAPRPPRIGLALLGVLEEGAAGGGAGERRGRPPRRARPSASRARSDARPSSSSRAPPRSAATRRRSPPSAPAPASASWRCSTTGRAPRR